MILAGVGAFLIAISGIVLLDRRTTSGDAAVLRAAPIGSFEGLADREVACLFEGTAQVSDLELDAPISRVRGLVVGIEFGDSQTAGPLDREGDLAFCEAAPFRLTDEKGDSLSVLSVAKFSPRAPRAHRFAELPPEAQLRLTEQSKRHGDVEDPAWVREAVLVAGQKVHVVGVPRGGALSEVHVIEAPLAGLVTAANARLYGAGLGLVLGVVLVMFDSI